MAMTELHAGATGPGMEAAGDGSPTSSAAAAGRRVARFAATSWPWPGWSSSCCSCSRRVRPADRAVQLRRASRVTGAAVVGALVRDRRLGRDMFSRVVYGARVSLKIGILATVLTLLIGVAVRGGRRLLRRRHRHGAHAHHRHLPVDPVHRPGHRHRHVFGRSENSIILVLGLTGWLAVTRIVRSSFLGLKKHEYVEAARALGLQPKSGSCSATSCPTPCSRSSCTARCRSAAAILSEAALSFLGVGPQAPTPAWGLMVAEAGAGSLANDAAHAVLPRLAIFVTVLAFVLVGDGLRDALDPKLKR